MATNMSRGVGSITVVIRGVADAPPLPQELNGHVSGDTWEFRLRQVRRLCAQYSKPLFERIWFIFAAIVTLVLPSLVHRLVFNAITPANVRYDFEQSFNSRNSTRLSGVEADQEISKYFFEARGITLGVFIGIVLVFWGPLIAWKLFGKLKANKMTARWREEDATRVTQSGFVPHWSLSTPGIFMTHGRLSVTTPVQFVPAQLSFFAPNAQLPAYIAQPAQNGGPAGGYFYNQGNGGQMYMPPPSGMPPNFGGYNNRPASPEGEKPMMVDNKYREHYDEIKV